MLPSAEYARVTFNYSGPPVPEGGANVLCFDTPPGPALFGENEADLVLAAWENTIMTVLDNSVTLVSILVKIGPDDTGISFEVPSGVSGSAGGQAAPPNVSYLVNKASDLGGRRGKGRMYLPGVDEDLVNESGIIDPTRVTLIQTACNDFLTAITTDEDSPVRLLLEHFDTTHWELVGGQPRRVPDTDTAPIPSLVTSLTVSNKVATQRRRLR